MIIAAGYSWRYFNPAGLDRHRVRHALSVSVLNFFLPALAFGLVSTAPADRSFIAIPLTAAIVTVSAMAVGFAAYRLLVRFKTIERRSLGVLILAAAFGNVTYLGLPVIQQMLGERFGYAAVLYDLLATTPVLLTIGAFVAARYGSGEKVQIGASLKRVLRLPPLWGVAAGLLVHLAGLQVPTLILDTASAMGKPVVPLMIFTVGLALDFRDVRRLGVAVPALVIKLLISPLIAWWVGSRLEMNETVLKAVAIEGAMPVMVLSLVIADEFDLDVPLAAACIAVSTIALFITMPVMLNLLF